MKKKIGYKDAYAGAMCAFFSEYDPKEGVPHFGQFARSIGVSPEVLDDWCRRHPVFAQAYRRCLEIQRERLINGGLTKRFDPRFARFMLAAVHHMQEKDASPADEAREVVVRFEGGSADYAG